MKHNIILIGFMGSGKTSVGHRLAQSMTYQFRDTDHMIERNYGNTISRIFAQQGEAYFRNMETDLLKTLVSTLDHTILSTGGGLPLRPENSKILSEIGYVVYLKASKETIFRRLKGDSTRPLLQGENPEKNIESMLKLRDPIYEKAAHLMMNTDNRTITEIVQAVMENYLRQIYKK